MDININRIEDLIELTEIKEEDKVVFIYGPGKFDVLSSEDVKKLHKDWMNYKMGLNDEISERNSNYIEMYFDYHYSICDMDK
ncbi:hypothetical protein CL617_02245 [archaeon]|nr:hypothetical protein [archaeon]|tara:strand:+ start:1588 stop:1833 length:246 start_codon:yes stop_codon:yes gene_type:complete